MSEESADMTQAPDNTEVRDENTLLNAEAEVAAGNAPAQAEGETEKPESNNAPAENAGDAKQGENSEDKPLLNPEEGEKKPESGEAGEVPEQYEFTLPEGFVMDETAQNDASALFHELKLSQGDAQKLIDAYTRNMRRVASEGTEQLLDQRRKWREEVRQDPNFQRDLQYAQRGMNVFLAGDAEAKEFFRNSWMTDHPAFFRGFARLGRLLGEDSGFSGGGASAPAGGSDEDRFPVK